MATTKQTDDIKNIPDTENSVPGAQNTTDLSTDANAVSADIAIKSDPFTSLRNGLSSLPIEDIKTFLARPIFLANFNLTTATVIGTDVMSFSFPDVLTGKYVAGVLTGGTPMVKDKISGFLGFRADIVFKLMINANSFQQGLLLIHWVPFDSALTQEAACWNANFTTKTQHHRVLADISCDSEVELRIPFSYPSLFYNLVLNGQVVNMGTIYVTLYSVLANGTSGSVDVELSAYASFENLSLMGPVYPVAQSGPVVLSSKRAPQDNERVSAGTTTGKFIDNILTLGTDTMSSIPVLSNFTGVLEWAKKLNKSTAAYFGYSTPILNNVQTSVFPLDKQYWNNCDVPRIGYNMGMKSNNDIGLLPGGGGTDLDEMSLHFIKQKFAYLSHFTFSGTAGNGTIDNRLFTQTLNPSLFSTQGTVGAITYTTYVPFAYLSRMFQFWRGSIIFRFIVVKTQYHSGRLMFVYNPGVTGTGVPSVNTTSGSNQYSMRTLMDIRESNTFEITVPFVSPDVWINSNGLCGTVSVVVVNPLRYPSTVASSVDVIVEVAAGPDFSYAVPQPLAQAPFCPTAQSGCVALNSTVGGSTVIDNNDEAYYYCIGEDVTSTRQILTRMTPLVPLTAAAGGFFSIIPTALFGQSPALAGGANQASVMRADVMSHIGLCYSLMRGSVNVTPDTDASDAVANTLYSLVIHDFGNGAVYDVGTQYRGTTYGYGSVVNSTMLSSSVTPHPVYKVPFYGRNPYALVHGYFGPVLVGIANSNAYSTYTRIYISYTNVNHTPIINRSIGDDFQFSNFVACPPLVTLL
jgi:hypothetical protein